LRAVSPDPFELEPNTALYVPRRATVRALAELQAAIEQDEPLVLLRGPAGIGKTLLLRLLRRRVEGRMSCAEVEAHARSADALCAEVLVRLGREPGPAPVETLARAAAGTSRGGVLLLIDRAQTLSAGTLHALLELAAHSPGLQIVMASESGEDETAWFRAPDPRIALVELGEPMSPRETIEYVRARLDLAVVPPEVRRRFGWRHWPRLIRAARGNPARLHRWARRRLAGDDTPVEDLDVRSAHGRGSALRWLGLGGSLLVLVALGAWLLRGRLDAWWGELRAERPAIPSAPPAAEFPPANAPADPPPAAPAIPAIAEEQPPAPVPAVAEEQPPEPEIVAAPAADPPEPSAPAASQPVPAAPLPAVETAPPPPPPARAEPPELRRPVPVPVQVPVPESPGAPDPTAAYVPVFVTAVPAARIEIDGSDVGTTPITGLPVATGTRRIVAYFPDGRRLEREVDVSGDEVYVLFP
jgi:type II secretory pathway predicted ATPase ExeA